jgi:glycosyltransferase involved in cell wall biosynthesis
MSDKVIILIPVLDDEASLSRLLSELSPSLKGFPESSFQVLVVDDGSTTVVNPVSTSELPVQVLRMRRTLGHQKALAIGLAYVSENMNCDKVLVMDGDGEDRPEDALLMLREGRQFPDRIVFAMRASRQEGPRFRFFYKLYKFFFRILTGRKIAFGNFLLMPKQILGKAVYHSEIWNHLAGGVLKAGFPYRAVLTDRGKRYAGESKMNFTSLLMHGLGAIAVFLEVIASRLLIFSLSLIGVSVLAILVILGIKLFTDKAIPGWTSTVISAMLIVLLQSFLLSLFTIFLYLSSQSQRKFIPAHHYKDYAGELEKTQHS